MNVYHCTMRYHLHPFTIICIPHVVSKRFILYSVYNRFMGIMLQIYSEFLSKSLHYAQFYSFYAAASYYHYCLNFNHLQLTV